MIRVSQLIVCACIPVLALGCSKPDTMEIDETVEKSEYSYQEKIGASSDERFLSREQYAAKQAAEEAANQTPGSTPDTPPSTSPTANPADAAPFHYDVPDGWTALPPTQFRNPNLAVGSGGDMECYVTVLPGGGGGIAGNINRWRGQFGVAEYTEEEIAELPNVEIMGFPGKVVNFSGNYTPRGATQPFNDYRLIGAVLQGDNQLITIKMTGPESKIVSELNNFAAFVDSLHPNDGHTHDDEGTVSPSAGPIPDGAQMPADHPPVPGQPTAAPTGPAPTSAGAYEWKVPEGWSASGNTSSMRLVTFTVTDEEAAGEAECYITVLSGDAGGRLANYNRWLGQFDLEPLQESELILQPPVYLFGEEVPMLVCEGTYTGMRGTPTPNQMLIGASGMINGETMFIKLVGPREVVRANWAAFSRFCDSIKLKEN